MPKFYIKTFIASVLFGIVLTLTILGLIPLKVGIWTMLNLFTFIYINEKLTKGEQWTIWHILLYLTILIMTTSLLLL